MNVIPIVVPPLRERSEDIPILVERFTNDISLKHKKPAIKFSDDAIRILQNQSWTGNVRELRNIVERIRISIDKKEISGKDIEIMFAGNQQSVYELVDTSNSFQEFKEKAERVFILKQLRANDWNISKTSEILEIQRSHLYNKMKKYGIEKEE